MAIAMSIATSIATGDGLWLAIAHHRLPAPRARVVLVHGYAEHHARYTQFVERLETENIECVRFDLRGHGTSGGPRAFVARFENYLDDLDRVLTTIDRTVPLFLFGHSLGGLITLEYVRTRRATCDAFAVSSPYLAPAFRIARIQVLLAGALSRFAPRIELASGLNPKWVSRDAEVVAAYASDPRIFRTTTPRWFTEIRAAQRRLFARAREITTPALFLVAGADRIADPRVAAAVFDRIGTADKQRIVYPELYHELLNELPEARAAVVHDFSTWLSGRLARTLQASDSSGGMHE